MTQRITIPTTGLTIGQQVQVEVRTAQGDRIETGEVTMLYEGGTVLVGKRVFRADGSERTLNRWGARLVGVGG